MAYTRVSDQKVIGGDFADFVETQTKLFSRQLTIRNSEEELKFNESVLAGNISLNEQLTWRKEQLKRISDDPEERRRIRAEVATLKDRIEQQTFQDEYIDKVNRLGTSISGIESVVDWLTSQSSSNQDLRIKGQIADAMAEQKAKLFKLQKEVIENETAYAVNDKSDSVLEAQIDKVATAKSKAILSGNDLLVSVYNLQTQILEKAKTENAISRSITKFAVNTMTSGTDAIGLLDSYNTEISNAPVTGNINVGNSQFGSAAEFWRYKRGEYLSDQSVNGFFTRLSKEKEQQLGLLSAQRPLTIDDVKNAASSYEPLLARPELKGYEFQIQLSKQSTTQAGTNYVATQILSQFAQDYDVNKAVSSLNALKAIGGNVTEQFDKIIQVAAANKSAQVNNILASVKDQLSRDPSITAEQAINTAIGAGAGSILSPNQLVGKDEKKIVSDQLAGASGQQYGVDPRTTAPAVESPPVVQPEQPPPPAASPRYVFSDQLDYGTKSESVRELQKFLNQAGFTVSTQGAGAPGAETDYFGDLTQSALQKFQAAQGIVTSGDPTSTGYGRLGPKTLEAINKYQFPK